MRRAADVPLSRAHRLECHATLPLLFAAGMDRYVRVYDMNTREVRPAPALVCSAAPRSGNARAGAHVCACGRWRTGTISSSG